MKNKIFTVFLLLLVQSNFQAQSYIGVWNYNSISGAPTTTNADIGNGNSSIVGSLVATSAGTGMDPIINNGCGSQNGTNPGAWSFTANPGATNESSGVQFMSSTVGFQNIQFTWDQRWSNTATNTVRVQYTTDGTTWNNFTLTDQNTRYCNGSINNGRFQNNGTGDQYRRISVNFSSIPTANNNPNFGVRLLAAHYQATTEFRQTSNSTLIATGGTWRFDNVTFEGATNVSIPAASNFQIVNENAGTITIPITTSNSNGSPVSLNLSLSTYSDATENADFTWTNTISIPANTNGITNIPIDIIDDLLPEKAERIIVKISSGSNALISQNDNYQIIFIKDNDYVAPTPTNELNLNFLTSFSNGATGTNSAEIVSFDSSVDRLYIANSIGGKLDIVNFSNPSSTLLISSIPLAAYGNINSVAAHDSIIALAIESIPAQTNGKVVFLDYNGNFISQVEVGAMPDMITFNKDYTKILTANEGEPNADYSIDPVGSVSIIDLSAGYANLTNGSVTTLDMSIYNGQETSLRAQGIRVFSTSASVGQDFEPEYITISEDNSTAYVTLQENNALLKINLTNNTIVSLSPLGYSSYGVGSNNGMDASDQSGQVLITGNLPIKGVYMPDAIAYKTIGGQNYIFTANEGDSREFGTVIDANRLSSSTFTNLLDATVFPDQNILRNNKFLGRLSALKYSGDTDGDGDYDEIHVMGGRSFSIFNPTTGALVFDSKDLIEQITASHPTFGAIFNASNSTGTPALKNRSDDKGPEPEGITVHEFDGKIYAFVALERIGGVMIFNVSNPSNPIYVGYQNNRSTTVSGPDLGAEGILTINAADSPNGKDIVILANEVSSTLSIYTMNTCAEISGAEITSTDNTLCSGDTTELAVNSVSNVNYQWILDNQTLASETNVVLDATEAGQYAVRVNNTALNCIDTSEVFTVTVNALPFVNAGNDFEICGNESIEINATGADNFVWSTGATTASISSVAPNTSTSLTYTVVGTENSTGCTNSDTIVVNVNSLPLIDPGLAVSVCENQEITLMATGADSIAWSGSISNNTPFIQAPGIQTYIALGIDLNGCEAIDSVLVTVFENPNAEAGTDVSFCEDQAPITLTANSTTASVQFIWNSIDTLQEISVSTSGTNTLKVIDINGCEAFDTVSVVFNSLPIVDLGSNQTICPENFPLTLVNSGFVSGETASWTTGETSNTIEINQAGTYGLEITNSNGCISIDEIIVTVFNAPTIELTEDTLLCENHFPFEISATSSTSNLLWNTGSTTSTIEVSTAGNYFVTATSTDGCTALDTIVITSDPCLNVNENALFVSLFPNPASEMLTIQSSQEMDADFEIIDATGKVVITDRLKGKEKNISTLELSNGVYVLSVNAENTKTQYRFIITK